MNEEDEAFNEIERKAKQRMEAVRAAMRVEDDDIQDYKKPWVGLTDDEVELYWDWEDFQCGCGPSTLFAMVRDIESRLKERNT